MAVVLTAASVPKLHRDAGKPVSDQPHVVLRVLAVCRYLIDPSYAPATGQRLSAEIDAIRNFLNDVCCDLRSLASINSAIFDLF